MNNHKTGTREEWLAARFELLKAEKEYSPRGSELTPHGFAVPQAAAKITAVAPARECGYHVSATSFGQFRATGRP